MSKFTPGPWSAEFSAGGPYITGGDLLVAVAHPVDPHPSDDGDFFPSDVTEANARLIAAAPELLDALDACVEAFWGTAESPDQDRAIDRAKAAIARASGSAA